MMKEEEGASWKESSDLDDERRQLAATDLEERSGLVWVLVLVSWSSFLVHCANVWLPKSSLRVDIAAP